MSAGPEKKQQQFHTERIASYQEKESERHRTVYADGSINEDAIGKNPQSDSGSESYAGRLREITRVLHAHSISRGVTPVKLREILEDLGPTFIKLGQLMSMRSDILPREYCDELMKLTSDVPAMPFDEVIRVIEESYGRPVGEVFKEVEKVPLGAASIAQVHRAVLATGGDVVVKVQREGIYSTMKRDIGLLHRAVKFVPNVIVKGTVDLDDVLDELWKVTQEEMDFQAEASNMEEFARLNEDVRFVAVPKLYREYTTERVLVMEYIQGCDITDKNTLEALGYDLNEIGEKLIDNWIRQVMVDGFFHADPHPGNILIRDGKIVWIDMGLMGRLTEHDRTAIQLAIEGIAEDDNGKIEDAVLSIGKFSGKTDKQKLHTGISSLMRSYGRKGLGDINIVSFLGDMMDVMKQNGVQMPHGLTLLARGLNNIEGVLSQVSPDVNMVKIAQARLRQEVFDHINWKEELRNSSVNLYKSAKNLADFPTLLGKLLREYSSGQNRINLDLHTSEELTELLGRLSRHFNLGIWVMALLVSSSILCTTDMKPKLFGIPALGFVGYVLAILLVIYIAVSYLIHRKKK